MDKINLKGLSLEEVQDFFVKLGEPPYRAVQLFPWIYHKGISDFASLTSFSKALRLKLAQQAYLGVLRLVTVHRQENAQKYLFALEDGNLIESVSMAYHERRKPLHTSVCVSTQAGCAFKCAFCASGQGGFIRNLTAAEIIDQIIQVQLAGKSRVDNVVLMGIGEPLANYDNVLKAVRLINDPRGLAIGARHITLSTCGLAPQIRRLADEALSLTLAVSLHAANQATRARLLPVARSHDLASLMHACRYYQKKTRRRITFEYVLIREQNDRIQDAEALVRLLQGIQALVNLIPLNPVPEFPEPRSTAAQIAAFQRVLETAGIKTTLRQARGDAIAAACGQLRAARLAAANAAEGPARFKP